MQLGNPVLEFATDFNSRAEYFWSHGLISDTTYTMFTSACNYSRYVSEYYRGSLSPICSKVMSLVTTETSKFVDKYDVTLDVCISSVLSQSKALRPQVYVALLLFTRLQLHHKSQLSVCVVSWVAASNREHRCMCGGWNSKLLEQKRCSEGLSCTASWSESMARLQQVKNLSQLNEAQHFLADHIHTHTPNARFWTFVTTLFQHLGLWTAWSWDTYDQRCW